MDGLMVFLLVMAALLAFGVLVTAFGRDSRGSLDDDWSRPWASSGSSSAEC